MVGATLVVALSQQSQPLPRLLPLLRQKLAMDSATVSLLSATENAIKANYGFRAVSAYPVLAEGDPIAVVTLLDANAVKIVTEKLY